ncbi:DUF1616 domain-containing protein [Methanosphaera sp. BMS]|uniref:DUF1616 domain-containing protein n=1 Tax=Methanosphaera sp. BMS TaxID=1789762 RepID=UPI0013A69215|nr:DUF1616 domain-containing protein [Methanosphaera sp. BMS]
MAKKPIQVITLAIFLSLVGMIITKSLIGASTRNFIIVLSIISIIVTLLTNFEHSKNFDYSDNKIVKKYFSKGTHESIYAIAVYCLVSFFGINVPPFSVIPLWFGLCVPFLLFIPGYLITNTVIPKKDEIELPERLGISVFLSLITMSIIGFAYAQLKHGLNMRIVTLILVFMTLFILIPLYLIRSRNIPLKVRFNHPLIERLLVLMAIISLILVILSGIYVNTLSLTANPGNTTFTIEGITASNSSDGYYSFDEGQEVELNISLTNQENEDVNYKVVIESKNESGNTTVDELTKSLKVNESAKIPVNITMTPGKKDITFTLYKNDKVYKIRHLYVNVGGESSETEGESSTSGGESSE